jgi:hypothetical protein
MNELEQTEKMFYNVQVSETPRPSGNSVADTQIQLLKLMDMNNINDTLRKMDNSDIFNYYGYEDWRDDIWEFLPACDTRNSDPLFFDTTWKNHGISDFSDEGGKWKRAVQILLYALVLIAVWAVVFNISLKMTKK